MRRAAIIALMLLIPACLTTEAAPTEVAAKKYVAKADAEAMTWANDSALLSISALETNNATLAEGAALDSTPGNGLAVAWIYGYGAKSKGNKGYAVMVTANGSVMGRETPSIQPGIVGFTANFTTFKIDSDAAAKKAMANTTFKTAASTKDTLVWMVLGRPAGNNTHPIWLFSTMGASNNASVAIDADNGTTILPADLQKVLNSKPATLEREVSTYTAAFNPSTPTTMTTKFTVANPGHPGLKVRIYSGFSGGGGGGGMPGGVPPPPTSSVNVTVTAPDGTKVMRDYTVAPPSGMGGTTGVTAGFPTPIQTGEYQVSIVLKSGTGSFNFRSCAFPYPAATGGGGGGQSQYPCT